MAKKPETGKGLDIALENLKGFMKKGSKMKTTDFVSTGHYYLDLAIAHGVSPDDPNFDPNKHADGGLPLGRVAEFSGGEGSGKSSESYRVVGNAQKMGLKCGWIDAEHSFSKDLALINGVDLDELDVADLIDTENPDHLYSAEEIFDRMCDLCKAGYRVIVLDSVANLMTEAETANYLTDGGVGMGAVAGVLSRGLKKLINYADKYNVLIILINQLREKIGVSFGNPEYTPGGRALKHACSVRVKMMKQTDREKGPIHLETENGPLLIGNYSFIYIQKNRHGKPVNGEIRIPIYYENYFPGSEDIIFSEGRKYRVIQKHLTSFRWSEVKTEGKDAFIQAIKDGNLMTALVDAIKEAAAEKGAILPPEVQNFKADEKLVEVVSNDDDARKVSRRRKTKDTVGEPEELMGT